MPPSSAQAYQSLTDYGKNRKTAAQTTQEANDQYGVSGISARLSGLRSLVGNLQSSVEQVDPSVTARLSGGFATEGQRSALVNREQAPILGNLAKQQSALGNTTQELGTASSLAGALAAANRSDDETGYQRLLDQYNVATAQEQAAEAKRQWEAQQAEQSRQFNEQQKASAKASGGYDIAAQILKAQQDSQQNSQQKADPYPNVDKQGATNAVKSLLNTGNRDVINRTIEAITKSAKNGNMYDKYKLELLDIYRKNSQYGSLFQNLDTKSAPTTLPKLTNTPSISSNMNSALLSAIGQR